MPGMTDHPPRRFTPPSEKELAPETESPDRFRSQAILLAPNAHYAGGR
jgi:hypothetical protein